MHWETNNSYDFLYCMGLERTHISEVYLYPWDCICSKMGVNRFSQSKTVAFSNRVLRSTMKFQSWFATKPAFSIFMNNLEPHWISLLPSSGFCSLPFFMTVPAFQDPIYVSEFPVERDSLAEAGGFILVLFFQPTFLLMTSNFLVSVKIVRPPRSIFHTLHHSIFLQVSKKISCHLEKKKKTV